MTTEIPNPELDICSTCGNTRTWHKNNDVMHGFSEPGTPSNLGRVRMDREPRKQMEWNEGNGRRIERPEVRQVQATMDPVVRMALVDAGILTLEQLDAAEKKIHFFTGDLGVVKGFKYRGGNDGD